LNYAAIKFEYFKLSSSNGDPENNETKNSNGLTNQREINIEQVCQIKSMTLPRKNKTDIKVVEQE
jgi:hypothetical protein